MLSSVWHTYQDFNLTVLSFFFQQKCLKHFCFKLLLKKLLVTFLFSILINFPLFIWSHYNLTFVNLKNIFYKFRQIYLRLGPGVENLFSLCSLQNRARSLSGVRSTDNVAQVLAANLKGTHKRLNVCTGEGGFCFVLFCFVFVLIFDLRCYNSI